MGDLSRLGRQLDEAVRGQGQVMPTENESAGYFGTMRNGEFDFSGSDLQGMCAVWNVTFELLLNLVQGASSWAVRQFLDSTHGRHFADNVRDELGSGPIGQKRLERAIRRAAAGRELEKEILRYEQSSPMQLAGLPGDVGNAVERVTQAWALVQDQTTKKNWKQRDDAMHALAMAADSLITSARAWLAQRR